MNLTKAMSEKEVARWEKARAKGKWFFVFRTAITFAVSIFVVTSLISWLFNDEVYLKPIDLIFFIVASPFVGLMNWWTRDARYRNHLLDKKISDGLKL